MTLYRLIKNFQSAKLKFLQKCNNARLREEEEEKKQAGKKDEDSDRKSYSYCGFYYIFINPTTTNALPRWDTTDDRSGIWTPNYIQVIWIALDQE